MSKSSITPARLRLAVRQIERQCGVLDFSTMCVLVSETIWCRKHRMSPGTVRTKLAEYKIETQAKPPEAYSFGNLLNRLFTHPRTPFSVSYGMGVDSTALLIYLARMYHSEKNKCPQYRPDIITFADVGNEKKKTYAYLPVIQDYLKQTGFPPVTVVRYEPSPDRVLHGMYYTLEQDCLVKEMLPSWAYHIKACSSKWKIGPQHAYRLEQTICQLAWAAGHPVINAIGYDAGPKDSSRRWGIADDDHYQYWYPLIELGWDRARCIEEIRKEGLPGWEHEHGGSWLKSGGVPVKSACWFCPSTTPEELVEYSKTKEGRMYLKGIVRMEANAKHNLTKIEGLWGTGVKGTRGGKKRPGSMTEFIEENNLLGGDRVELPLVQEFDRPEMCAGCY